jgi:predicted O-methyltransferase YrrM
MFQQIPQAILERMRELEQIDSRDRTDGTPRLSRLRQIPAEVGKFIALLAAAAPPGRSIEIGTSAGYSTLWLALACRASGKRITTYEILPEKAGLARQTFDSAGVWDVVELVHGNALDCLPALDDIGFCFLDAEKEIYAPCYELLVPRMRSGGILVADNAINHVAALRPMLERALQDDRLDALIVPIGNGELICRKR